jgi:hypothetical protein
MEVIGNKQIKYMKDLLEKFVIIATTDEKLSPTCVLLVRLYMWKIWILLNWLRNICQLRACLYGSRAGPLSETAR